MKRIFNVPLIMRGLTILAVGSLMSLSVLGQTLPTATETAQAMTVGWNLGNSLEATGGETAWGNPPATQQLIDSVKAAGFNTIRLPCAWDSHADQTTLTIDPTWLARVKQVVDYCINDNMYVILNIHWDGGWLENNVTTAAQASVNVKQNAYWTQIANYFKNYDGHLLFASANEPNVSDAAGMSVLLSYHQTFIDAVRATGGNNSSRVLIIQGPSADITLTNQLMTTLPTDQIANHMMVEIHYYTPYQFCLMTADASWGSMFYYWGQGYHSTIDPTRNATWGEETDMDNYFQMMTTQFVNNGIPVILGEFGVIKRTGLADEALHIASREYYYKYLASSAINHGLIPICWDNGASDLGLFDRNTGAVTDQGVVDAIMQGAGVINPNRNYTVTTSVEGSGTISLSPSGGTYKGGTNVTVTATPSSGYSFLAWGGDLSGSQNPATILINANKSVTAIFALQGTEGSGTILREYWTNIGGSTVADLTSNANYPDNPTGSEQLTSLEGPTNWADAYGDRIRGYIHPPVTGSYTFWVAGDDNTQLFLSTDDTPGNATMIAYVDGYTNPREWTKYPSQTATVNLTAGQIYYIEVLHKEAYGGDNEAVAWQGPGISQAVIDGKYLSPWVVSNGTTQYTLSTSASGSGTVSLSPAGGTYDAGTVVTVTATASSGYQFSNWSGDLSGSTNPTTITMNGNHSVTANFSAVQTTQYTLSTSVSGSGSISLSPAGGTYDAGTVVTVTATASSGYQFSGWGGDLNGSTNPTTITMNGNKSVSASFTAVQPSQYTLNTAVSGSGSISLSPSGGTYDAGTVVTVTATASAGSQFNSWSGDLSGSTNPTTITMNANHSVTANFSDTTSVCSNPTTISVPFSFDGAGEYCWVTSANIAYINSWNLDLLEINGQDYTNTWSNSLPAKINGNYYIHYKGSFAWSHFEAPQVKDASTPIANNGGNKIFLFPNPFTASINLVIAHPEKVKNVAIFDQLGRKVETLDHSAIQGTMRIGQNLEAGMYIVRILDNEGIQSFTITKN